MTTFLKRNDTWKRAKPDAKSDQKSPSRRRLDAGPEGVPTLGSVQNPMQKSYQKIIIFGKWRLQNDDVLETQSIFEA